MELKDAVYSRRSVRNYAANLVSVDLLNDLVKLASTAPSACDRRGWRCILVQERESLDWLYLQGGSSIFERCSQALVVCYEAATDNAQWHDNIQSAAAFIAYFQLLAHERAIGSCWICHLPPKKEVSRYFGIPADFIPIAVITFGYYQQEDQFRVRPDRQENLVSLEKWSADSYSSLIADKVSIMRRLLRYIYYLLPFRASLRTMAGRYEKKFDE